MRRAGPVVVLVALVCASSPCRAGTMTDPEVLDVLGDHAINPIGNGELLPSPILDAADLLGLWIDNETEDDIRVHLQVTEIPFMPAISSLYRIRFDIRGLPYVAEIVGRDYMSFPVYTPRGVAEEIDVDGNVFSFSVKKSNIGNPSAGDRATKFYVTSAIGPAAESLVLVTDRAPDDGFGRDYRFHGAPPVPGPATANSTSISSTASVKPIGPPSEPSELAATQDTPGLAPAPVAMAMLALALLLRRRSI